MRMAASVDDGRTNLASERIAFLDRVADMVVERDRYREALKTIAAGLDRGGMYVVIAREALAG